MMPQTLPPADTDEAITQRLLEELYVKARSSELKARKAKYYRPIFFSAPQNSRGVQRVLGKLFPKIRASYELRNLRSCGLFDGNWYLMQYPDVAKAGFDPLRHYLKHGASELRDPGPNFSTSHYLSLYPDVKLAGINPLVHYFHFGWEEMRLIHPSDLHASGRN